MPARYPAALSVFRDRTFIPFISAKLPSSPAAAHSRLHVVAAVSRVAAAPDTSAAPARPHTAKSCPTPSPTATHPPLAAPTRLCPPVPPAARSTSHTLPASRRYPSAPPAVGFCFCVLCFV